MRNLEQLHRKSNVDQLTGLLNRSSYEDKIKEYSKDNLPDNLVLVSIDLNNLKTINDSKGHAAGDEIIKGAADCLQQCLGGYGDVYRIGGDEFLCLVPKMHIGDAKVLAVKMQNALIELCGEEAKIKYHLTASVGIAAYPDDTADGSEMVQKADLALFAAKQEGKGSIARYEASNDEIVVRDERIEEAIRNALENDKFYLVYQPQFFSNKKLRGFESLIRMDNEGGELIGPADFIPVAEKSDLNRRIIIRSMAMEGILGHMGTRRIHSIEAGLILIADGCDMTKGRARIPMELNTKPSVGDIHKYSANSIESGKIHQGSEKPIQIEVFMSSDVGFFQIEEVLISKINSSPAKCLVELFAGVEGQEMKKYL